MHSTSTALSILLTLVHVIAVVPANTVTDTVAVSKLANALLASPSTKSVAVFPLLREQKNVENTCGHQNGKVVQCDSKSPGGGACCSRYGFCGNSHLYCGEGCQAEFGDCNVKITAARQRDCGPNHKNKKCGPDECCSANRKCGRSKAFCGKHCQPEFGICHPRNSGSPKPESTTHPQLKPDEHPKRCGKDFAKTKCTNGECCSAAGWCGKGKEFCSVPQECQRSFGICDSDAVPKGFDLSPMFQPRRQLGKIPYGQVIQKCTQPGTAALSFDDGPSNNTMAILDVLRDHKAKATFFLSGNTNAKGMIDEHGVWIEVVKRIITDGHQIGSHTWSHPHLNAVSRDQRLVDMIRNDRAITNIIGKFPTYMRPPYVECSKESGCLQDMSDLGYHVVGWDIDSHDWELSTTLDQMKTNVENAIKDRKSKDTMFLIMHDHNKHVVDLTKHVLEQIQQKKWNAVTLGECLNDPAEFWYSQPIWVEPKSIANDGLHSGCVVSAPAFCGPLLSFSNNYSCGLQKSVCNLQHKSCIKALGYKHSACIQYGQVCDQLQSFCNKCKDVKNSQTCKSHDWSFNRLVEQKH